LEIIDAAQKFCGKTLPVRLENRRAGEPGILTADNGKAKQLLGWTPRVSDLPTVIESAWKWHQLLFENAHLVRSVLKC
jgi:UDP-glucose 4-epimerase